MQRRTFFGQGAAALAGATLAACGGGHADTGDTRKPTFVFVHGAWHGGWCWSETVRLLALQGYPSVALDLPGHAAQAKFPAAYLAQPQDAAALATEVSPLAALTLNDYRDHALAVIRGLMASGSGPVILVGHSLGGATLSAVAEADPSVVRRLVYLTAFVPVVLPTVLGYLQRSDFVTSEVPPLFAANPETALAARLNCNSTDATYRAGLRSAFYHDVTDDQFSAAANLLTPDEPIQAFTTAVNATTARWGKVPRTFIRCTADRAIPVAVQDRMISEADAFTPGNPFVQKTLATSHSSFLSSPADLVTQLIASA